MTWAQCAQLTSVSAVLLGLLRLLGCMPGDLAGLVGASEAVKEPGVVGRDPGEAGRPKLGCVAKPPCNYNDIYGCTLQDIGVCSNIRVAPTLY